MKRVILLMLLVAAMAGCAVTPQRVAKFEKQRAEAEIAERVSDMELVKQEQQLIYEIMKLRYETAKIQQAMQPKAAPPEVKE